MAAPSREEEGNVWYPPLWALRPCAADEQVAAHIWNMTVVEGESDCGTIMP